MSKLKPVTPICLINSLKGEVYNLTYKQDDGYLIDCTELCPPKYSTIERLQSYILAVAKGMQFKVKIIGPLFGNPQYNIILIDVSNPRPYPYHLITK